MYIILNPNAIRAMSIKSSIIKEAENEIISSKNPTKFIIASTVTKLVLI